MLRFVVKHFNNMIYIYIKTKKILSRKISRTKSAQMVETIDTCKWPLKVIQLFASGINRPGEMVRSVEGLTTKVLIRVAYKVTEFGERIMGVLDELEKLQRAIEKNIKIFGSFPFWCWILESCAAVGSSIQPSGYSYHPSDFK